MAEFGNAHSIGRHGCGNDLPLPRAVRAVLTGGNGEAGGQALDIPFPGSLMRFVEIVHVENEVSLGRRVEAKIRGVTIAANLRVDSRFRRTGQIGRHDDRRATVKRQWRTEHSSIANRD